MSKKHKNIFMTLNYTEQFLILASAVTVYISISVFVSLVGIEITSSAKGLENCAITTGLKNYNCIFKKNKKK